MMPRASPELWNPFSEIDLVTLIVFIKAIKFFCLPCSRFISLDRLSNTFQNVFPLPVLCAGIYLFFLFLDCSDSFFKAMSWNVLYVKSLQPASPRENYSPLYSHKTWLPLRAPSQDVSLKWFVLWTLPSQGPWFTHLCVCQHNYSWCHSLSSM